MTSPGYCSSQAHNSIEPESSGLIQARTSTEIQDQEWEQRCEQASIPPEDLNKLIIEFLATEVHNFASCCADARSLSQNLQQTDAELCRDILTQLKLSLRNQVQVWKGWTRVKSECTSELR